MAMANKRFIISSENVLNTYGFRVMSAGIKFPAHVPAFDNHKTTADPVGHWANFELKDGDCTAEFVPNLKTQRGKEIAEMVADGHLGQASLGIDVRSIQASGDKALLLTGQKLKTVVSCIAPEVSIVNLASNRNAVALHDGELGQLNLSANDPSVVAVLGDITIESPVKTEKISMEKVMQYLKLADDTDQDGVLKVLKAKDAELVQLRDQLKARTDAERDTLLTEAIAKGKITAAQRPHFVKLFENDFETTKNVLAGLEARQTVNLADYAASGSQQAAGGKPTHNGKTWLELSREQPKELEKLKADNLQLFKLMYKADVGTDWID